MDNKLQIPMYCSLDAYSSGIDASWIKLPENIDFYLMFELPEPWERKIELSKHFSKELYEYFKELKLSGKRFKFLCIKTENKFTENTENKIKLFFYYRSKRDFLKFKKIELDIPSDQLLPCVQALINIEKNAYNPFIINNQNTRDIFVCTHNERDQCCGLFGTVILNQVEILSENMPNLRIWASSHMGGHRIGPTLMDMPSGRFWGYLKSDDVEHILNQEGNHFQILNNYRGMMGLGRYSQIMEKAIFEELGWKWFENDIKGEVISQSKGNVEVKIDFQSISIQGQYTATVSEIGKINISESGCSKGTTISKFKVQNLVITENSFD